MPKFAKQQERKRWTVILTAGDPVAVLSLQNSSNVTIELIGGGSVAHSISGTAVIERTSAANDAYQNNIRENTFTYTPGTSALITIDEEI